MKRICFLDSNYGVWEGQLIRRYGINFREAWTHSQAIKKQIGGEVKIYMVNYNNWSDITNWVKIRAKNG